MHRYTLCSLFMLLALTQCRNANPVKKPAGVENYNFQRVVSLDSLKQTEFVPTLENTSTRGNNVIYTSSFLFAWDELKHRLEQPFKISVANYFLATINNSNSYKDALDADEYNKTVTIEDNEINIHADFKQSQLFRVPLDTDDNTFKFKGVNVKAFGMPYYNDKLTDEIKILYYKNDEEFIMELIPENTAHEIILAKGFNNNTTLDAALVNIAAKIKLGDVEREDTSIGWKYELTDMDRLIIPVLNFNIETHYKQIEGDTFFASSKLYQIKTAYQRTAFVLDQHGAKVESEADIAVAAAAAPPDTRRQPKKLLFNSDYIVLLRKTGRLPYFMMKVENAELMQPLKGD